MSTTGVLAAVLESPRTTLTSRKTGRPLLMIDQTRTAAAPAGARAPGTLHHNAWRELPPATPAAGLSPFPGCLGLPLGVSGSKQRRERAPPGSRLGLQEGDVGCEGPASLRRAAVGGDHHSQDIEGV